jgi:hypothetical protein
MKLKQSVENKYGNKIEKGEQVVILSNANKDGEVYIIPLKTRGSSDPIGMLVKRELVE